MKNIILLNGLPRAGKDTVADYLCEKYRYKKMSFADALKDIICGTFNISREELDIMKNNIEDYHISIHGREMNFREILQRFGTEGMKPIFGEGVWADILYTKIQDGDDSKIVIPDFRFLSEYQVRINTHVQTVLVKDKRELPLLGHASDVELYQNNFKFDFVIENTGSIKDLYNEIERKKFAYGF